MPPFRHPAITPLVQSGANSFVLELFHGPTLAFKDVAMQLIARLMDHVLAKRGERATIVGATSGDTGGAAIDAFAGRDRTDIFILFPEGRVSPVQQRQMTTSTASNVHALALKGNFDDCQDMVKAMFNHAAFPRSGTPVRRQFDQLGADHGPDRLLFHRAVSLGAPDRKVSFTVPTGNFGDIFAGYCAKRMGLPIDKLVVATNENDILARTMRTGRYEMRGVTAHHVAVDGHPDFVEFRAACCLTPMTGIPAPCARAMSGLKQSGAFDIAEPALKAIRKEFRAGRASERQVKAMIR
jgi:threonine synthase